MSDDIIKVLDLPGIAEYSQSINKFSKSLSTATNDTARTFNIQIEGSEGEAINAFLQSLNDLQGKIFNQIPEVLKNMQRWSVILNQVSVVLVLLMKRGLVEQGIPLSKTS